MFPYGSLELLAFGSVRNTTALRTSSCRSGVDMATEDGGARRAGGLFPRTAPGLVLRSVHWNHTSRYERLYMPRRTSARRFRRKAGGSRTAPPIRASKNFECATGRAGRCTIVYLLPSCSRLSSPLPGSSLAVSSAREVGVLVFMLSYSWRRSRVNHIIASNASFVQLYEEFGQVPDYFPLDTLQDSWS